MEFKQLEAFYAVATEGGFSKGAQKVFLSQPTVSAHIKSLEKELGCNLFLRTTKAVRLTEEGKSFLPYVARMLELKEKAVSELTKPCDSMIRIAASTIPSGYLLPDLLAQFREAYPRCFFSVIQSDSDGVEEMVLDGAVDVGFSGKKPQDKRLSYKSFCSDTLVFATPVNPYYLELQKTSPDVKRLLQEPMIIREQGSGTRKAADLFLKEQKTDVKKLQVVARTNDLEAIKRLIASGSGCSILSGYAASDLKRSGQAILYPLQSRHTRQFYRMHLKDKAVGDMTKRLFQYVDRLCESDGK